MDTWDVVLIVVAAYLAVMALVRLMNKRREQMLTYLREEMEQAKDREDSAPDKAKQGV